MVLLLAGKLWGKTNLHNGDPGQIDPADVINPGMV